MTPQGISANVLEMKNKRPELVLNLRHIDGEARKIISTNVQNRLFQLGYSWNGNKKAQSVESDSLHIFSPHWSRLHITYADGYYPTGGGTIYFDVAQMSEFLSLAEEFATIKTTISGVDVTIVGSEISLDATKLLSDITIKAKKLQDKHFCMQ